MSFTYEIKDRLMIVTFGEEIDHHIAEEVRSKIDKLIEINNIKTLILDFYNTNFMDSSGIGVIMGRYKNMKNIGGNVGIINVNDNIDRVLKLSGIYTIVKQFKDSEEAIKKLV